MGTITKSLVSNTFVWNEGVLTHYNRSLGRSMSAAVGKYWRYWPEDLLLSGVAYLHKRVLPTTFNGTWQADTHCVKRQLKRAACGCGPWNLSTWWANPLSVVISSILLSTTLSANLATWKFLGPSGRPHKAPTSLLLHLAFNPFKPNALHHGPW